MSNRTDSHLREIETRAKFGVLPAEPEHTRKCRAPSVVHPRGEEGSGRGKKARRMESCTRLSGLRAGRTSAHGFTL